MDLLNQINAFRGSMTLEEVQNLVFKKIDIFTIENSAHNTNVFTGAVLY